MDYNQAITYGPQPTLPGQTPIVTAGQDWGGITPAPTANSKDMYSDFPQWAAMNGIAPEIFRGLSPEEQNTIKNAYLNRNSPPPAQPSPPAVRYRGTPRSYIGRKLFQVNQTPQVNNLY